VSVCLSEVSCVLTSASVLLPVDLLLEAGALRFGLAGRFLELALTLEASFLSSEAGSSTCIVVRGNNTAIGSSELGAYVSYTGLEPVTFVGLYGESISSAAILFMPTHGFVDLRFGFRRRIDPSSRPQHGRAETNRSRCHRVLYTPRSRINADHCACRKPGTKSTATRFPA
jgi:hypothetical protein